MYRKMVEKASGKQNPPNRLVFQRLPGTVGLYVDIYDASPVDKNKHGSQVFFIQDLTEKLFCEFQKIPFDVIKGTFERLSILDGVIIEEIIPGIVFVLGFDHPKALQDLWQISKSDILLQTFQRLFISPSVLQRVGAKQIVLRCKVLEDEEQACRHELVNGQVGKCTWDNKANDRGMVEKIKEQQKETAELLYNIREDYIRYEQFISDFVLTLKQNDFYTKQPIKTISQFQSRLKSLHEQKKSNLKPFDLYVKIVDDVRSIVETMETKIFHRLAQIHARCESENQKNLRISMKQLWLDMQCKLKPDFDFSKLRQLECIKLVPVTDQKAMNGLVSLPAYAVESIVDVDHMLDEYISGALCT